MENVYVMKKIFLSVLIFFIAVSAAYAQTPTEVIVRAGKHSAPGTEALRLVFEAEETFIRKANVLSSDTQINIEFPSAFNIRPQKGFELETIMKNRALVINLKEPSEIKTLRLSSPSRLVIDIFPKGSIESKIQTAVVLSQKIFVMDAGHGGYDFGIVNSDLKEKDIALSIAKDIEALLIKKGKAVYLTKKSDQFMSLKDRAIFANQKMPDLFISIHASTSGNFVVYAPPVISGPEEPSAELYSLGSRQKNYAEKSRLLAENIGRALKEEFNLTVIHREMSLPLLNSIGAPAVLIEAPSFSVVAYDQKTRARLAEAIIKGISYYGQ